MAKRKDAGELFSEPLIVAGRKKKPAATAPAQARAPAQPPTPVRTQPPAPTQTQASPKAPAKPPSKTSARKSSKAPDPAPAPEAPPPLEKGQLLWLTNAFELPSGIDQTTLRLGEPKPFRSLTIEYLKRAGAKGIYRVG